MLHAFQKKSKTGRATPRRDMELIKQRLREAEQIAREKAMTKTKMTNKKRNGTGSRNVFKDIGVPNAEEHLVKAQLVFKIDAILKARGLKQGETAELFGVRQPDVSKDAARRVPPVFRGTPASLPGGARSGRGDRGKAAS